MRLEHQHVKHKYSSGPDLKRNDYGEDEDIFPNSWRWKVVNRKMNIQQIKFFILIFLCETTQ